MIRLTYYFFYALSLLPLWVLYGIGDFFYLVLYYLIGYRKKIVWQNLQQALPDTSPAELQRIRRRFYRCFIQNWMETVKLLSISTRSLNRRFTANWDVVKTLHQQYPRIQILLGHCFNWEWGCANTALQQPYLVLPVYLPISSKPMDALFISIRSRFGSKPVRAGDMARELLPYRNSQYMLALLADQSPPIPQQAYWVNFMHRPTGFIKGPERNARLSGVPVVYLSLRRKKRGHYHLEAELFCEHPAATSEGELTRQYARRLQQDIEASPHTYLWSHRRWKHAWQTSYERLWRDNQPLPGNPNG